MKKLFSYFTKFEICLWSVSVILITVSFFTFGGNGILTLVASLIGATSLIFALKGNPVSQALMIVFSILYGIISFSFRYYGEMITYLGMTLPMSAVSMVAWLKNPHEKGKAEVEISSLKRFDWILGTIATAIVTFTFYLILKWFNTANLVISTISVTTSFFAAFLTFKRSPFLCFAYALNDCVLIVMWVLASLSSLEYISVVVCFVVFLANDGYCFINWLKIQRRQNKTQSQS